MNTDIEAMSDEELTLECAKIMGWKNLEIFQYPGIDRILSEVRTRPDPHSGFTSSPPRFAADPAAALSLCEWMNNKRQMCEMLTDWRDGEWQWWCTFFSADDPKNPNLCYCCVNQSLPRAIAVAFLKANSEE